MVKRKKKREAEKSLLPHRTPQHEIIAHQKIWRPGEDTFLMLKMETGRINGDRKTISAKPCFRNKGGKSTFSGTKLRICC